MCFYLAFQLTERKALTFKNVKPERFHPSIAQHNDIGKCTFPITPSPNILTLTPDQRMMMTLPLWQS